MAYEFETTTWKNVGEAVQYSHDTPTEFKTEDVEHYIEVSLFKHKDQYVISVFDREINLSTEYESELAEKLEDFIRGKMSFEGDEVWVELDNGLAVYDSATHRGKSLGWEIIKAWINDELENYIHEEN